jgi:hypothetical protein
MEGPGEAPKVSQISNRRLGFSGDLDLRVHWHRNRLVVHHACSLKNIESELTLSEEEPIRLMLYGGS